VDVRTIYSLLSIVRICQILLRCAIYYFDYHIIFYVIIAAVDVTVGLSKSDPLYVTKNAYLTKAGRGATSVRFPLQFNRYPSELVDFLRFLLVEPDDLGMQVRTVCYVAVLYGVMFGV